MLVMNISKRNVSVNVLVKEKISINISRSIKNVSRNIKVIIKKYLVIEYVSNVSRSVKK